MSLESFASKAYENSVAKPASNIVSAVKNEPNLLGKAPALAGEIAKEAAFIPLRNIGSIMSWTTKKMLSVLGGTVSLVGSAAMLVPLPIPGVKNGAEIRGNLASLSERIRSSAQGKSVRFSDSLGTIGKNGAGVSSQAA